jgi:two-component system sensor histidine kinase KdpD
MVAAELFHRAQRARVLSEHLEVLKEADRTKDAVLASVSHDLRTPLTTIWALATQLRETGDERAAVIEEEAERLNRMVSDLLDLSRIRIGALPLNPEVNAAEDLLGSALAQLRGVTDEERIRVQLPTDGTLPLGRFDFVQALRALSNLLENALRHSPPGETVEVSVSREAEFLVFRISDAGPGIPPEVRTQIFDPFFQGKEEGQTRHEGAGLGLAIARRVAEAQGGSVTYRDRAGGGSVFELRLPGAEFPTES